MELESDSGKVYLPRQAIRSVGITLKEGMSVIPLGNINSENLYDQNHDPVFFCTREKWIYRFHPKKGMSVIPLGNINSENLYDQKHEPVFFCPIQRCIYRFDQK